MLSFRRAGDAPIPGLQPDSRGRLLRVSGPAEIHQALTILLSTRPGERRLNPDFGCDLDLLLFEPNDETTAGLALRLVANAVARHEPRARIDRIDAGPDPRSAAHLVITLTFTDRRNGGTGSLHHSLDLGAA